MKPVSHFDTAGTVRFAFQSQGWTPKAPEKLFFVTHGSVFVLLVPLLFVLFFFFFKGHQKEHKTKHSLLGVRISKNNAWLVRVEPTKGDPCFFRGGGGHLLVCVFLVIAQLCLKLAQTQL